MYRLFEITLENGTESQAITSYDTETEALAKFHSKYGAQIKSPYYDAQILVVLDNIGKVVANSYHTQDEANAISPRLLEVKVTTEESLNASKYDTAELVIGNFHSKLGSAMDNADVKAEMLRGIDGKGNTLIYQYWVRPIEVTDTTEE